jgi:pilus assembly protein Flp/PilA
MFLDMIRIFRDREEGQAMVEYALILALVSVVAAAALTPLGTAIASLFTSITGQL